MSVNVRPLQDRVIVERKEPETISSGGIVIPDTAGDKKTQLGRVLAVGPGKTDNGKQIAVAVAVDDTVVFGKYSGTEVSIHGQELLILNEDDIMGVVQA